MRKLANVEKKNSLERIKMSETGSLGDVKVEEIPQFDDKDDRMSESADGKEF